DEAEELRRFLVLPGGDLRERPVEPPEVRIHDFGRDLHERRRVFEVLEIPDRRPDALRHDVQPRAGLDERFERLVEIEESGDGRAARAEPDQGERHLDEALPGFERAVADTGEETGELRESGPLRDRAEPIADAARNVPERDETTLDSVDDRRRL